MTSRGRLNCFKDYEKMTDDKILSFGLIRFFKSSSCHDIDLVNDGPNYR